MSGGNRLAVLAADIRTADDEVCRSVKSSAERAVDAGRALAEAKASDDIPRGGWERWVEQEAGVPWSTAKHYIQLFCAIEEQRLTLANIAEAGQTGALRAADGKRREPTVTADIWTPEQRERRAAVEAGRCVVANMHDGCDSALLAWANAEELFVRIDRKTEWGNPFEMPDDGERAEVVSKFSKFYLPHKDGLLAGIPSLRGKVLGCWCHPEECHGHVIAEIVNRQADGEGTAEQIADQLAQVDGRPTQALPRSSGAGRIRSLLPMEYSPARLTSSLV